LFIYHIMSQEDRKTKGRYYGDSVEFTTEINKQRELYKQSLKKYEDLLLENKKKESTKYNKYPSIEITRFDDNLYGNLIIADEINLRRQIIESLDGQGILKSIGYYSFALPGKAKQKLLETIALSIRYKRLTDLIFRASSFTIDGLNPLAQLIDNKLTSPWVKWASSWLGGFVGMEVDTNNWNPKKPIPSLLTDEQYDSLVNSSLDVPICLHKILQLNDYENESGLIKEGPDIRHELRFKDHGKIGRVPEVGKYYPKGYIYGVNNPVTIYLDTSGNFADEFGRNDYVFEGIRTTIVRTLKNEDQKTIENKETGKINITSAPHFMQDAFNFIEHRIFGNEFLPKNDNTWPLPKLPDDMNRFIRSIELHFIPKKDFENKYKSWTRVFNPFGTTKCKEYLDETKIGIDKVQLYNKNKSEKKITVDGGRKKLRRYTQKKRKNR
jgi:hypothetical protein